MDGIANHPLKVKFMRTDNTKCKKQSKPTTLSTTTNTVKTRSQSQATPPSGSGKAHITDPEDYIDAQYNRLCVGCDPSHVTSDNKVLQCESCEKKYCIECVEVAPEEYTFLTRRKLCHWYCPACEAKVVKAIRVDAEIEVRCKKFMDKMESRIERIEADMSSKVSVDEVQALIQEQIATKDVESVSAEAIQRLVAAEVEKQSSDKEHRDNRLSNLILHNMPEDKQKDYKLRAKADTAEVIKLIQVHIGAECDSPEKVTRIGERGDKPRPVKVVLKTEEEKRRVLRRANKLRDAPKPYSTVSVSQDMTLAERDHNRQLLAESKALNEQEQSGDWLHLVRGVPWDRQIVRVRRRQT